MSYSLAPLFWVCDRAAGINGERVGEYAKRKSTQSTSREKKEKEEETETGVSVFPLRSHLH